MRLAIIRYRSRGPAVKRAQQLLNAAGFGPLVADGVFGRNTRRAIRQFQAAQGLSTDGVVGPNTWSTLITVGDPNVQTPAPLPAPTGLDARIKAMTDGPAKKALLAALKDVGAREVPDGSNTGPALEHLVEGYREFHRWPTPSMPPWCMIAISSWIGISMGLTASGRAADMDWSRHPFGTWAGGTAQIEAWAKRKGCSHPPESARPGDIFTMGRNGSNSDPSTSVRAGHVGLVTHAGAVQLHSIEGNKSNSVTTGARRFSTLRSVVRWVDTL